MKEVTAMDTEKLRKLKEMIEQADAVVIGAGAGLSASAGYTYAGKRFETYFSGFRNRYGIGEMYSGGFYNFLEAGVGMNTPVFYVLNPIRPKMAKNSRFYPGNGYFMKELSRITDSERLRRCA